MKRILLSMMAISFVVVSNAQRKIEAVESNVSAVESKEGTAKTIKRKVAIGRFSNETTYGKGLFYDKKNDPMGKQALDILSAKSPRKATWGGGWGNSSTDTETQLQGRAGVH